MPGGEDGKKTAKKGWKRLEHKIDVCEMMRSDFTRNSVKYKRFIRSVGLRYKKA
jgi:hypothetical protein